MLYREFADQEALDAQYNPTATAPDAGEAIERWITESEQARADLDCHLGVAFGATLDEYVDIFPTAESGAPVHLFIHGGYWRRFSAREFSGLARALVGAGVTVVISNYSLCPKVTIDEITRQSRAAIAWIHRNIADYGGDPGNLTISGHSAGGHLVGMALATDWAGEYGLPPDLISGALSVSGIFDLAPLPYCYVQPAVQLTWDQVRRNSPIHLIPERGPPLVVAVGGAESAEFHRQSRDYLAAWQGAGLRGSWLDLPGLNHFNAIDGFTDLDSPLGRALLGVIGKS